MSIIGVQRRLAEVGRIRIGHQVPTGNGKTRPAKLDRLRFTSSDKRRIEQIASLYGGEPQPWEAPAGSQWEVYTDTADVPIVVPPTSMAFSQHLELWSRGGCQRRCDGVTEQIGDQPCVCDPEDRECTPHSRLSVMLRDLQGLGLWRCDTQGHYAMNELAGAVELIHMAAGQGAMLPARLRLDQRVVVRNGETRKFPVPVIDVEMTAAELVQGVPQAVGLPSAGDSPALPQGDADDAAPPLTPVPAQAQQREPAASLDDQLAQFGQGSRRRTAEPIPEPGLPDEDGEHDGLLAEVERLLGECEQAGADVDADKARKFAASTVPNARRAVASLQGRLDKAGGGDAEAPEPGAWPTKLGKGEYAWLREIGVADDMRPKLVAAVTDGATQSSRDLDETQVPRLLAAARAWADGDVSLVDDGPDGHPVLLEPSGEVASVESLVQAEEVAS